MALYLAVMETHSEDKKLLCRLLVIRIQDILSAFVILMVKYYEEVVK